jgi:hypothetical protein
MPSHGTVYFVRIQNSKLLGLGHRSYPKSSLHSYQWAALMDMKRPSSNDDRSDEYLFHHSGDSASPSLLKIGFRWSTIRGRRLLFATCACLATASLCGLLSVMIWTNQSIHRVVLDQGGQQLEVSKPKLDEWSPLTVLRGPPTDSLWGLYICALHSQRELSSLPRQLA